MTPQQYDLIDKVYGNYCKFQKCITTLLNNYRKDHLKVLELGTGTGITTNAILTANKHIELATLDIDFSLLEYVRCSNTKHTNVTYICEDVRQFLPACQESYDIVVSGFLIHNFSQDERNEIYRHIYRILLKGANFINIDKFIPDNSERQITALQHRLNSYCSVLSERAEYEILKEWIVHYVGDYAENKRMPFNAELNRILNHQFSEAYYLEKLDDKMMGALLARK